MSEPTKAELQTRVNTLNEHVQELLDRLKNLDPEAKALDAVVKSLNGLPAASGNYSSLRGREPDRNAVRRVLDAAARRFDLVLDYSKLNEAVQAARLAEEERAELDRLRAWAESNPSSGVAW